MADCCCCPLAIAGFIRRTCLAIPAVLIAIPRVVLIWARKRGLCIALTLLPGFRSVRAPVHIWFVIALGLALAAALGSCSLSSGFASRGWRWLVIAFSIGDLWYWNMSSNPLTYAR